MYGINLKYSTTMSFSTFKLLQYKLQIQTNASYVELVDPSRKCICKII